MLLTEFDPSVHLFRAEAPISESVREYIRSHLHLSWYRKRPYAEEHFESLRAKTTSILNAFLLSMRVYDLGYPIISLANTLRFSRTAPTSEGLRTEWTGDRKRGGDHDREKSNRFWRREPVVYRKISRKARPFSLENVLDLLERNENPKHL
jgi:hypothetical protein